MQSSPITPFHYVIEFVEGYVGSYKIGGTLHVIGMERVDLSSITWGDGGVATASIRGRSRNHVTRGMERAHYPWRYRMNGSWRNMRHFYNPRRPMFNHTIQHSKNNWSIQGKGMNHANRLKYGWTLTLISSLIGKGTILILSQILFWWTISMTKSRYILGIESEFAHTVPW